MLPAGRCAVAVHVGCGIVMMVSIVLQLNEKLRAARPRLHRWTGRAYVVAGVGALLSLRWLRASSGAGSSKEGDVLMAAFIDVSSVAWVAVTFAGVDAAARRKDFRAHRWLMQLSVALAALPILQRILNALILCPAAMALRCVVCLFRWRTPPWLARWGAPGCSLSLLLDAPVPWAATSHPALASDGVVSADPDRRASPMVLGANGYGESEQAAFGLSAWVALLLILGGGLCCRRTFEERCRSHLGDSDDAAALAVGRTHEPLRLVVPAALGLLRRGALRLAACMCSSSSPRWLTRGCAVILWLALAALAIGLAGIFLGVIVLAVSGAAYTLAVVTALLASVLAAPIFLVASGSGLA